VKQDGKPLLGELALLKNAPYPSGPTGANGLTVRTEAGARRLPAGGAGDLTNEEARTRELGKGEAAKTAGLSCRKNVEKVKEVLQSVSRGMETVGYEKAFTRPVVVGTPGLYRLGALVPACCGTQSRHRRRSIATFVFWVPPAIGSPAELATVQLPIPPALPARHWKLWFRRRQWLAK